MLRNRDPFDLAFLALAMLSTITPAANPLTWIALPGGTVLVQLLAILLAIRLLMKHGVSDLLRSPHAVRTIGALSLWILFALLSSLWSLNPSRADDKLLAFATRFIPTCFVLFVVGLVVQRAGWRLFAMAVATAGAVTAIVTALFFGQAHLGRLSVGDDSVFIQARTVLVAFVAGWWGLCLASGWRERSIFAFLCLINASGVVLSGNRGSLVGLVVAVLAMGLWFSALSKVYRSRQLVLVGLVFGAVVVLFSGAAQADPELLRSVFALQQLGNLSSDLGRQGMFEASVAALPNLPLYGYGLASFGWLMDYGGRIYPHNLILEVLLEQGIVGLVLLIATFGSAGMAMHAGRRRPPIVLMAGIVAGLSVGAMVSGDVPGNATLIGSLCMIAAMLSTSPDAAAEDSV